MRKTHIVSSVLVIVLSLALLFWIIPEQTEPPMSKLDLPPSFIPSLAVTVCLILAVILGLDALLARKRTDDLHEEFGEEASGMGLAEFKNLGLWAVASVAAWYATVYIGFEPAMIVFLAGWLLYAGLRNYWLTAVIAIATPIILSQFAWHVFTTQLPGFWRT